MFFNQKICEHIGQVLIAKNAWWIIFWLVVSWIIAIFFGWFFIRHLIKFLQQKTGENFNLKKKEYSSPLKDEWVYWVNDNGFGKYNAWLGIFEITLFYICLLVNKPEGIGAWLVFKVAAKWESWANIVKFPDKLNKVDDFEYLKLRNDLATVVLQRFLIGTILNVMAAIVGVATFFIVIMAIGRFQELWLEGAIGILIVLTGMDIFQHRIINKLHDAKE